MAAKKICDECGADLPLNAPFGLCPRCLIGAELRGSDHAAPGQNRVQEEGSADPGKLRQFGDYELLEEIARGGMGVVYKARQITLNRLVAVKMLLFGEFSSDQFVKRFRLEAEAAASLHHPNIVAIHEIGTHASQHYFSMDCIEGQNLAEYARDHPISGEQAATLIKNIAEAIHYAHQRSILHRDLKPGNILIDKVGTPHVTDFGLARLLTKESNITQSESILGTPNYMAPEQAAGRAKEITTAADVYGLGAVFYHLLTGQPPFEAATPLETMRKVIELEPKRPSLLKPGVDRDLESICLKCLEKEPQRRYGSAEALSEDLNRWLRHEPVAAAPPSTVYKMRKFVRRHRASLAAVTTIFILLVAGGIISSWQAVRARRAEKRAIIQAHKSRQIAQFLEEMLRSVGPSVALGRDTKLLREILDKTAERVGRDLKGEPEVESDLRATLGETYSALGLYAQAEAMHRQALILRQQIYGNEHQAVAQTLGELGRTMTGRGDFAQAEDFHRKSLALYQKCLGPEDSAVATELNQLSIVLGERSKLAEAEELGRKSLALSKKLLGETDTELVAVTVNLARLCQRQGNFAEAEKLLREALVVYKKRYGTVHPSVSSLLNSLGQVLRDRANYADAEKVIRESLEIARRLHGEDHPEVATSLNSLAMVLENRGDSDGAETVLREALAMRKRIFGEEHPHVASTLSNLGAVLQKKGDLAQAEEFYRSALTMRKKLLGGDHETIARSMHNLASLLEARRNLHDAEALYHEALDMEKRIFGDSHPSVALTLNSLGRLLRIRGDLPGAEKMFDECLVIRKKALGLEHPYTITSLNNLAVVCSSQGKFDSAETSYLEAIGARRKLPEEIQPSLVVLLDGLAGVRRKRSDWAGLESLERELLQISRKNAEKSPEKVEDRLYDLADLLYEIGRYSEAEIFYRERLEQMRKRLPTSHDDINAAAASLGRLLADWSWAERSKPAGTPGNGKNRPLYERAREAETLLREALAARGKTLPATNFWIAETKSRLGAALLALAIADTNLNAQARLTTFTEAEAMLHSGWEGLDQGGSASARYKHDALERLVRLYEAWDGTVGNSPRIIEAAKWKQKLEEFEQKAAGSRTKL